MNLFEVAHFVPEKPMYKSLEEQLVEFKTEIEKLTSAKLLVESNSKEKDFLFLHLKVIMKSLRLILLG